MDSMKVYLVYQWDTFLLNGVAVVNSIFLHEDDAKEYVNNNPTSFELFYKCHVVNESSFFNQPKEVNNEEI